ncbi:MAG: choice-of-anchor D domain-containing protein [Candidatus Aminicenantes bacterium]|nr:choice-of-anchor D domain-containing protein [Candidatus Aminicenantes bacterium]
MPSGHFDTGYIFYQRLDENGALFGPARQISYGPDDLLNDVSGDFIVFTAFDDVVGGSGQIMLFQISTNTLQQISAHKDSVREARIYYGVFADGDVGYKIVWVEGENGSTMVMYYELRWIGTPREPSVIAGPVPPANDVEIGDRYAVWSEQIGGQRDVFAYDLQAFRRSDVASSSIIDEASPSTSGEWVVWQANDLLGSRIEAYNVDTRETRTIIDDGFGSYRPSIHGDLLTYENDSTGDLEVYVYRLSTGDTFQVTSHPDHQYLNDVFGDLVAYVDMRSGSEDIYVSKLDFLADQNISVSPTEYDFGPVELGSSSQFMLDIINTGEIDLVIESIGIQAGGSSDFSIGDLPSFPYALSATEVLSVEITYNPSALGASSAVLAIVNNDPDESLVEVNLDGTGFPPNEQIASILEFLDVSVYEGTLVGSGPGNSADIRLNALRNMLENARDLIEAGLYDDACRKLLAAYKKTDGNPKPPDFVEGEATAELAQLILDLMNSLGC